MAHAHSGKGFGGFFVNGGSCLNSGEVVRLDDSDNDIEKSRNHNRGNGGGGHCDDPKDGKGFFAKFRIRRIEWEEVPGH